MNNSIIYTIKDQLKELGVLNIRGIKLIKIDDLTLRIHRYNKNIDIKYNEGTDAYDCTIYTIKNCEIVKTETFNEMYCDQLVNLFC